MNPVCREYEAGTCPNLAEVQEIEKQARTIREKTACNKVDFRLYLEDNRVSLKAKPVKDVQKATSCLGTLPPGSSVSIRILRKETESTLTIKMPE